MHHDVFRRFVPGAGETPVTFSSAADPPIEIALEFELDPAWVAVNVKLVAFVQNLDTKEIEQAAMVRVSDLDPTVPTVESSWGRIKSSF